MLNLVVIKSVIVFFLNDFQLSVVIKVFEIYPIHFTAADKFLSLGGNAIWAVLSIGILFFVFDDVVVHNITLPIN